MKNGKISFVCRECGHTSMKWLGRCPECSEWNSFDEVELRDSTAKRERKTTISKAEKFSDLKLPTYLR